MVANTGARGTAKQGWSMGSAVWREHKETKPRQQEEKDTEAAVPTDAKKICKLKPGNRLKWLQVALMHAAQKKVASEAVYDVITREKFVAGMDGSLEKQLREYIKGNVHVFNAKQQKFLQSKDFERLGKASQGESSDDAAASSSPDDRKKKKGRGGGGGGGKERGSPSRSASRGARDRARNRSRSSRVAATSRHQRGRRRSKSPSAGGRDDNKSRQAARRSRSLSNGRRGAPARGVSPAERGNSRSCSGDRSRSEPRRRRGGGAGGGGRQRRARSPR
eukprot:TRINITY_DN1390_c1_g1_i1.p2 TRINITY_DN1390_c1_g1~~TRINITY_DN1390_c1_g1_i1.p2  ORF type:complete len:277 (-),score=70.33 TRINITY_DN1390_c1_g1_i1:160-990(-)